MFNLEQSILGDRNENSPNTSRRKRPLSIIEENQDDEDSGAGDKPVTYEQTSPPSQKDADESVRSQPGNKTTNSVNKRIRRSGISNLQHPVLQQTNSGADSLTATPKPYLTMLDNSSDQSLSGTEGYFSRLRDKAAKLNLKTRRQSYLVWRAKYIDQPRDPSEFKVVSKGDRKLTKARMEKMDNDLKWIIDQLRDMRKQDQSLAQQLLGINQELSNLRLQVSCEEHRDLLDDAQDQMDDLRELSRFLDFPSGRMDAPLRHIGVTKMNLSSRRFSTC